jgi:hypothetical protein
MRLRNKLTYANVVATLALFLVVSGGAVYGASHLGKNSVGAKQLKKNAVTTAKIKNQAVTAAKVKKGSLTGIQINASSLGTVPTADKANSLAAPEAFHKVGAAGEPGFQNSWDNQPPGLTTESVGFYKDQEGVVHLKGAATGGSSSIIFQLPAGYRPASGKVLGFAAICSGCAGGVAALSINGSGFVPGTEGAVVAPDTATRIGLDGITFRAAS